MVESNTTQGQEASNSPRISAERLLSAALGNQIHIHEIECLTEMGRRNLLLRCCINPIDGLPSSFIIKKVEVPSGYNPDDAKSWDTSRFFNDWVGSQFLSTISSTFEHSPRFYGGDRNLGLIVLEDVQHVRSLVKPLLGSNRTDAERALLQYSICLGHLHTETIGKAAEFGELYRTIAPNAKFGRTAIAIDRHQSMLENLGIQPEANWLHDIQMIEDTLNQSDDFLAYVHADACPDNVLDTGDALRLIDFETGHFGHALIDAAYGRMMFPSCWCANRLPSEIVQQMENTYRAILVQQCPVAEDDQIFETALVNVCGFWLLYTLTRHFESALKEDVDFGISTIRQRILARLEAFIAVSQEFNQLSALRGTSSQLLDLLRRRWFNVIDLPLYPAFQGE
jgi:hypothetical protein